MKKILLTSDLILNKSEREPGDTGVLLIEQDHVGYHVVTLADGNVGDSTVDMTPGVITKLTYIVDDETVYWTSEVLNPVRPILAPAAINDLTLDIVNTSSVRISWTAPKGDAGNDFTAADQYVICVSEANIDENTNVYGLQKVKQTLTPKRPGQPETFVVTKLIAGRKYYLTVISRTTLLGRTRQSANSNIISFYTYFDSKSNTTQASIIPFRADSLGVTGFATGPVFDNPNQRYDQDHMRISTAVLADHSNVIDLSGVPAGTPSTNQRPGLLMEMWGDPYGKGWFNFDHPYVHFDLQGSWNITAVYVQVNTVAFNNAGYNLETGSINLVVKCSTDGTTWKELGSIQSNYVNNDVDWLKVDIDTDLSANAKYLALGTSSFIVNSFAAYGIRQDTPQLKGVKHRKETPKRDLNERIGINAFLAEENPDMIAEVSGTTRVYNEAQWIMGGNTIDALPQEQYDQREYKLEDVRYKYAKSFMWDYDAKMTTWKNTGQKLLFTINNSMPYLRYNDRNATNIKPVDPHLDFLNLDVTTNPLNYKHYARYAYNLIARYGSNKNVDQQYLQVDSSDTVKVGLDLIQYFEPGNEIERAWHGEKCYGNPEEHAAFISAVYDGHKGAMGPGFGMKAADPNMKLLNPGMITTDVGRIWRMVKWWDKYRGEGDYPIDILNVHFYSVWNRDASTSMWSDQPAWGLFPEAHGSIDHELVPGIELRNIQMPNKEFWVTETGYDEQNFGTNSPNYPTHFERARYKSYWIIRSLIQMFHRGVDVVTLYWWANTTIRVEDINPPESKIRDTFLTCGFTDGVTAFNDWNRKWLTAGYYVRTFKHECGAYDVAHEIYFRGTNKLVNQTSVIGTYHPELCGYALEGKDDPSQKGVLLWITNVEMNHVPIKVYVASDESLVEVVEFEGAEQRKTLPGRHYFVPVETDAQGKFITVQVGECPLFVKTKNVGTPKLVNPEFIQVAPVSTTAIKIAWTDKNTIANKTTIFVSDNPNNGFTVLFNGLITDAEYVANGLEENKAYYFKVQLQNGPSVSDLSAAYGATTLISVPTPRSFALSAATTTTLKLSWELTDAEQKIITGFQLFKSLTIDGPYDKVADIAPSVRNYTDTGLVNGTDYFYKLRSTDSGIYFSPYTFTLTATTALPSNESPVVTSSAVNYAGDTIMLKFDQEVKDAAGSEAAFTIIRGASELVNVAAALVKTNDKFVVHLKTEKFIYAGETLTISYDWTKGTIRSATNIPVDSFTGRQPVNHAQDPALLVRKGGLNILNADYPGQDEASDLRWTDIYLPEGIHQSQGPITNMVTGAATGWRFLFPNNSFGTLWNRGGYQTTGPIAPATPEELRIRELFPDPVRQKGSALYAGGNRYVTISGLDTTKLYNIYVFVGGPGVVDNSIFQLQTFDTQSKTTWKISNGKFNYGILSEISPSVNSLPGAGSNALEYVPSTKGFAAEETVINRGVNDIMLTLTNLNPDMPGIIAGILIEEIKPIVLE